eukprot:gnl/TRDRNA2_/TRDRNA2_164245_c0_seq1.p1 gnl/TRDRNA2_/TRDRNA2_164245_c0~~gnl/TRDRNA2_/TRDRNA2_164245_c0_seq1.p1  ORF type:complete len:505 (-),score=63.53 gnl/TRDRNA2_/TRDRNA2_164245_c0_seq1:615-2129(-)
MTSQSLVLGEPISIECPRTASSGRLVACFSVLPGSLIGAMLLLQGGRGGAMLLLRTNTNGQPIDTSATGTVLRPDTIRISQRTRPLWVSNTRLGSASASSPFLKYRAGAAAKKYAFRARSVPNDVSVMAPASIDDVMSSTGARNEPFRDIDSAEKLVGTLDALLDAGKISSAVRKGVTDFLYGYKVALSKSPKVADADKEAAKLMAALTERVLVQFKDPYTFPAIHGRIQEPYDYYAFGQRFFGNLIDFDRSFVVHAERIVDMQQAIARGENVLIFANHQSEGDPGIWAWLTQDLAPAVATDTYYVAGDRVVLDPIAKPFSMGRNLICVHSRRHLDDDPELKEEKMKTNQRSVREFGKLFKEGGAIVWVAPSGGRDRKDDSGEYALAAFDSSAVMVLQRMMELSGKAYHVYPMAMASAEIMPPPSGIEKELGEKRVIDYHGVGISIGEEIHPHAVLDGIKDKGDQARVYTSAVYEQVKSLYAPLADVIYGKVQAGDDFKQPWKK